MTKEKSTTELNETELDQVAGGLSYKLQGVAITSFQTSGSADSRATEDFSLNYEEIKHTYSRPK